MNALLDNTFLSCDHKIRSNALTVSRRRRKYRQVGISCFAASVSVAALMTATAAQADMAGNLTIIGTLGGNSSDARGVSGDGSVVVGTSSAGPGNGRAFQWTSTGGVVNLLGAVGSGSAAQGVSSDGSTIVGYYFIPNGAQAFSFTNGVRTDLTLAGKAFSQANAVSANGQVVVGIAYPDVSLATATRWVNGVGTDLGLLAGGTWSYALGVSADGSVVAGYGNSAAGTRAFRWEGGVKTILPTLSGNTFGLGVSGDGTVIVGQSQTASNKFHAFRWSAATGIVDIEADANAISTAYATNSDGSVVVGSTLLDKASYAYRWTQATGMQKLDTILAAAGVNMNGRTLWDARAISGNGEFIVGSANIDGVGNRAYLVRYYETTTGIIAGVTDATSVQTSVDGIGDSRNQIGTQQQGFTSQLLQEDIPFFKTDYFGAFGSVGSASGGLTARYDTGPFTLKFGAGMAAEDYKGGSMRNALLLAASARYTAMLDDSFGLYGEAGGMWSPSGRYKFSRTYANGAGTATGIGETWGQQGYVFGKIGAIFKASATDTVTPYLELGYQTLQTGAYSETLSAANPFEARVAAATNGMGVVKLKGQWTHAINDDLDFALTAGWGHGFNRTDSAAVNVTGFGTLTPNYRKATDWAEYGVRASYRFDEKWTGSVFANGVIGGSDVGSNHHFGVSALMRF